MVKIRFTKNGNLMCPRETGFINKSKCMGCDDLFSIVPYSHILCKRGRNKDEFLSKSKNIMSGRYARQKED